MQLNNLDLQTNTISYVESSPPILSALEGSNGPVFTGQNGILTSNSNRGARDFCLLLVGLYTLFLFTYIFFCYKYFPWIWCKYWKWTQ
jgi:hypothetical protein